MSYLIFQTLYLLIVSAILFRYRHSQNRLSFALFFIVSLLFFIGIQLFLRLDTALYNYGPESGRWVTPIGGILALPLLFIVFTYKYKSTIGRSFQGILALGLVTTGFIISLKFGAIS